MGLLQLVNGIWQNAPPPTARPNALLNANFVINQRGYVSGSRLAAASGSPDAYGHDAWYIPNGTSGSYTFSADANGSNKIVCSGPLSQRVPGYKVTSTVAIVSWKGDYTYVTVAGTNYSPIGTIQIGPDARQYAYVTGLTIGTGFVFALNAFGKSFSEIQLDFVPASGYPVGPFERRPTPIALTECQSLFPGMPSRLFPTLGGDNKTTIWASNTARSQLPRSSTISSISGSTVTLSGSNDAYLFYNPNMGGASYVRITNLTQNTTAWISAMPAANQLTFLSIPSGWANGDTLQIGDSGIGAGVNVLVDIGPMLMTLFGSVFMPTGILLKGALQGNYAALNFSPTGIGGTYVFVGATQLAANAMNNLNFTPLSQPSPITGAPLIYVRENQSSPNSGDQITQSLLQCLAVAV